MTQTAPVRAQLFQLMLGKITDTQPQSFQPFTLAGRKQTRQGFDQGRFTRPVRAEQAEADTGLQGQRKLSQDRFYVGVRGTITGIDAIQRQ